MSSSAPPTRATRESFGDVLRRACARIALAVLLLGALEWFWARRLEVDITLARVVALLATLAVVLAGACAAGAVLVGLTSRLGRRGASWVDGLLAAPVAWHVADRLCSGGWIRTLRFHGALQALLALALVASAVIAGRWVRAARRATDPGSRLRHGALALVCLLLASAADNLVEVGHYLPFHLTLAVAVLGVSFVLALVVWPVGRPAPRLLGGLAMLLLAILGGAWLTVGDGEAADDMVRYTNGLLPKARLALVQMEDQLVAALEHVRRDPGRELFVEIAPPPNLLESVDRLDDDSWQTAGRLLVLGHDSISLAGDGGGGDTGGGERHDGDGNDGDQSGALSQQVRTPLRAGARLLASARVRPAPGSAALTATLALTLPGTDGRHATSSVLAPGWNELGVEVDSSAAQPMESEALSPRVVFGIDPDAIRAEQGLAWITAVPAELGDQADNRRAGGTPGLVLLEDGVPIGPNQPRHALIREVGGGAYSHWSNALYFSSSDGSDPRRNGRRYELASPAGPAPSPSSPTWTLEFHGQGAAEVQDASLVDLDSGGGAELARKLAEEFLLVPTGGPAAESIRAATRNVIVVLLDAVRDDHVGPRADGASLTPQLDGLAADGVRFSCTYSPSDHTGRSVPCIATSLPLEVTLRAADLGVPLETWVSKLAERGFRTFNNGSDYIRRKYAHVPLPEAFGAQELGTFDSHSDELCAELLAFVAQRDDRPFAAYTHWSYAHVGFSPTMVDDYAAMVQKCDDGIGALVAGLRERGEWDRTLLVVTADHGYGLGERNRYLGAHGCAELSVRVPLILHVPGLDGGGLEPSTPVSNLAIGPTLLDVLDPGGRHVLGAASLLPLLLEPEASGSPPVFSSTGNTWMTRDGDFKLTEEADYRSSAVFDMEHDADGLHPLQDPRLTRRLQGLREREQERQTRLAQALVAGSGRGIAPVVASLFAREHLDADAVEPLVQRLWSLGRPSREYVLAELYRRRIGGLGAALAGVRRASHQRDDDLLLVVAAWAGAEGALDEVSERLEQLHPDALAWFAATLVGLDDEQVAPLAPALVALTVARWSSAPALTSDDGRLVAMLCRGLAARLPAEQLGPVKDVAIELNNAWAAEPNDGPYFASLEDRKFERLMLLQVFREKPVADDLARAERLLRTRDFGDVVARMCKRLDTPEAKGWLLELLAHWSVPGERPPGSYLCYVIPILNGFDDAAFRAAADRVIQERFPYHPRLDP